MTNPLNALISYVFLRRAVSTLVYSLFPQDVEVTNRVALTEMWNYLTANDISQFSYNVARIFSRKLTKF